MILVRTLINTLQIPYETSCRIGVSDIIIRAFTGENIERKTETESIISYAERIGEEVMVSLLVQEEGKRDVVYDIGKFIIDSVEKIGDRETPSAKMTLIS